MKIQPPLTPPAGTATPTSASAGGKSRVIVANSSGAVSPSDIPANQAKQPTPKMLQQAVEQLQRKAQSVAPSLQFSIDHDSGRVVIKVTDVDTQEVIRQIPAEEILHLNKEIDRMRGLLFHKQA